MDVWRSVKKACLGEAETPWPVGCHGGTTDSLEETSWDARASLDGAAWIQQWFLFPSVSRLAHSTESPQTKDQAEAELADGLTRSCNACSPQINLTDGATNTGSLPWIGKGRFIY